MPHRQSWFHGTYDKLTNTLSYVLLCHFHLQLPDNRHKWHTHTNPPPITSVVEPSLPQASNPIRQQCHDRWGTVHLRPEPIIAPQPRSPSNHCPAAAGGEGPEPVPHTPLMDSPRALMGTLRGYSSFNIRTHDSIHAMQCYTSINTYIRSTCQWFLQEVRRTAFTIIHGHCGTRTYV